MYSIEFTKTAEKQLYNLPADVQSRVIATLERIRVRPYPHVKRLVNSHYFRLRVGDYRVLLDIKEGKLMIYVIEVGHRKEVYK